MQTPESAKTVGKRKIGRNRIGIVLGDEGNLVVAFGGKSDCRQEEGKKD